MNSIRARILKNLNRRRYTNLADALDAALWWAQHNLPHKQYVELHDKIEANLADTRPNRDEAIETLARHYVHDRYDIADPGDADDHLTDQYPDLAGLTHTDTWKLVTVRAHQLIQGILVASPAEPADAAHRLRHGTRQ